MGVFKLNKLSKGVLQVGIAVGIEICTYLIIRPKNLEMFFFIWIFILTFILFYNVLFTGAGNIPPKSIPCAAIFSNKTGHKKENFFKSSRAKDKLLGGINDPINMIYLVGIVINIIAYRIVM